MVLKEELVLTSRAYPVIVLTGAPQFSETEFLVFFEDVRNEGAFGITGPGCSGATVRYPAELANKSLFGDPVPAENILPKFAEEFKAAQTLSGDAFG